MIREKVSSRAERLKGQWHKPNPSANLGFQAAWGWRPKMGCKKSPKIYFFLLPYSAFPRILSIYYTVSSVMRSSVWVDILTTFGINRCCVLICLFARHLVETKDPTGCNATFQLRSQHIFRFNSKSWYGYFSHGKTSFLNNLKSAMGWLP